jgi:hypothetical protein
LQKTRGFTESPLAEALETPLRFEQGPMLIKGCAFLRPRLVESLKRRA